MRVSFLILLLWTAFSVAAEPRKNILFLFADDWGRYASAYAAVDGRPSLNDIVKTPNVDRIAKEGVIFRNAFVNAPSCTPCRSALLSGRYFWATGRGAILQGAIWDEKIPSFPLMLNDTGYHIGQSWKVWSPGTPNNAPFGVNKFSFTKSGLQPNNFSENATRMMVNDDKTVAQAREAILAEVAGNFDAFRTANAEKKPWLYWCGPTTTHRTWIKGSGQKLWNIDPDSLKGKIPPFLPDVPEIREDVADYLGEVQAVDAYIGVLLKKLEEAKELDNTVVVVSGDHGMPGVPYGKCNLYDHGTAVTLAVRYPGGTPGRIADDFVQLMDLAPTFLEIGGVKPAEGMHGKSIVPLLTSPQSGTIDPTRDFVVTGRERHVAAAREDNLPYPMRAVRTANYLYIRNFKPDRWPMGSPKENPTNVMSNTFATASDMDASPTKAWIVANRDLPDVKPFYDRAFGKRPAEELYLLKDDPHQMNNLAGDARHATAKDALAKKLAAVMTATRDPRLTDDFDKPPFSDAVERKK